MVLSTNVGAKVVSISVSEMLTLVQTHVQKEPLLPRDSVEKELFRSKVASISASEP